MLIHQQKTFSRLLVVVGAVLLLTMIAPCLALAQTAIKVDFDFCQAMNPDMVAWLYQASSGFSQPIMQGEDNSYYTTRGYDLRSQASGSIFLDAGNASITDDVITLYGRKLVEGEVFSSLSSYLEQEYYEQNPSFLLITPEGSFDLTIFAGLKTTQRDTTSWIWGNEGLIETLKEESFLQADASLFATEEDRIAMLTTSSSNQDTARYVLYATVHPLEEPDEETAVFVNKAEIDAAESTSGLVTLPNGETMQYYAQNDPLYAKMLFDVPESATYRTFEGAGCGPSIIAMMLANLVPTDQLPDLLDYAKSDWGYSFCTCSVNRYGCAQTHVAYNPETSEEFVRYLPVIIANYALGNNIYDLQGRTSKFGSTLLYVQSLCDIYGLTLSSSADFDEVIQAVQQENTVVLCSVSGYGNFFTLSGHYLLLADVIDDELYILDPLQRDDYSDFDSRGYLTVHEPGLVSIPLEVARQNGLGGYYIVTNPNL